MQRQDRFCCPVCENNQTPVNRSNGSKCSRVEGILERWRETLNYPFGTVCPELDAASSVATPDIDICTDEPTLDEVMRAVKKLKNGRAAGCDIPPELLKCALPHVSQTLPMRSGRMVSLSLCIRTRDKRMNAVVTDLYLSFPVGGLV